MCFRSRYDRLPNTSKRLMTGSRSDRVRATAESSTEVWPTNLLLVS